MTAGRSNITIKTEYNTPPKYVDVINSFFNNSIDLDPCSNNHSLIKAKNKYILPINGLKKTWNYEKIFVNPPYGRDSINKTSIKDWLLKGKEAYYAFHSEVLYLIPVATNTKHFKDIIFNYAKGICFLNDTRLKFFYDGKELEKGAPMACCFVYFGFDYNRFQFYFSKYGKCFEI